MVHEVIGITIVGVTVMPTIASCIHRITHRRTNGRHGSKKVVLIKGLLRSPVFNDRLIAIKNID